MTKWRKIDHGFVEIKRLLRKKLLAMISPSVAVDFFAGEGKIICELYREFDQVHAVEKNPAKARMLNQRLLISGNRDLAPKVRTYCMDNREFARTRMKFIRGVNLLDFDAYGNPNPLIAGVFNAWKPEGTTVIAVTDGGKFALCRGDRVRINSYLPSEKNELLPAAQGARRPSARVHPLIIKEYELLVRTFWQTLAGKHGFFIKDFIFSWKKGRMVLYYGLCIEPD
jgi:tRNA G37 N-methylase Trm5